MKNIALEINNLLEQEVGKVEGSDTKIGDKDYLEFSTSNDNVKVKLFLRVETIKHDQNCYMNCMYGLMNNHKV